MVPGGVRYLAVKSARNTTSVEYTKAKFNKLKEKVGGGIVNISDGLNQIGRGNVANVADNVKVSQALYIAGKEDNIKVSGKEIDTIIDYLRSICEEEDNEMGDCMKAYCKGVEITLEEYFQLLRPMYEKRTVISK